VVATGSSCRQLAETGRIEYPVTMCSCLPTISIQKIRYKGEATDLPVGLELDGLLSLTLLAIAQAREHTDVHGQ
jgi:hypothetical protein